MEIGDRIMFLHKGEKLWEGTRENIMDTDVKELQEFIFANSLMRAAKKVDEEMGSLDEITTIKDDNRNAESQEPDDRNNPPREGASRPTTPDVSV
jgi:phospholipid/cholesterol/gamma-HCH transport system ATP-binding protein